MSNFPRKYVSSNSDSRFAILISRHYGSALKGINHSVNYNLWICFKKREQGTGFERVFEKACCRH
jgi:hypothetical protein